MFKIITDLKILNDLNAIVQSRVRETLDSIYCEPVKHPLRDEWIIVIDENLLKIYNPDNLEFLLTDNVPNIPDDYNWPFPQRKIRLHIPLKIQAKSQVYKGDDEKLKNLKALISSMLKTIEQYVVVNDTHVIVYLEELYQQHKNLLELCADEGIHIEEII